MKNKQEALKILDKIEDTAKIEGQNYICEQLDELKGFIINN